VAVFCEDSFHEAFCRAILDRLAAEFRIELEPEFRSAIGGLPKLHGEFRRFLRDIHRQRGSPPDAIVVLADANCQGYAARRSHLSEGFALYPLLKGLTVFGIPDPHIERWMLVDSQAFKRVFGRGCTLPAVKCAKDHYKKLLNKEIRNSDIEPALGGQEFAEDIVAEMDFQRAAREPSLDRFLRDLRAVLQQWQAA
jgi:hypothetical protein